MIFLFLPVKPKSKGRPRFIRNSNSAYTPKSTRDAENTIKLLVKSYMNSNCIPITKKPVTLDITFVYKNTNTKTESYPFRSKRPDLDNLIKLVADSCNGIVYEDDAQIVQLSARKVYGEEEGINLEVWEIGEADIGGK